MEEFILFILFFGFIGLIIWISNLSGRITAMEYAQKRTPESTHKEPKPIFNKKTPKNNDDVIFPWEDELPETINANGKTAKAKKTKAASQPLPPTKPFNLEEFLLKKLIPVAGVITLILSIGFFGSWAFSSGIIGPEGRIAIGILFSIITLGVGEFLRPKYPKFFDKISAAGIGGLLVTIFLARNYEFATHPEPILTATQTFGAACATVITGIVLSLRYNARFLGNFTIIGGLIAPLMTNSDPNVIGLLSYLAILSVAGFTISLYKKWPEILGILFIGVTGYEIGILNGDFVETQPMIFLYFIFGLHLLIGSGGIIRCLKGKVTQTFDQVADISTSFELLLFVLSVFIANLIGYQVFDVQEWAHFGFFILAQGFAFFFLSELFKQKKLEIFQKIALGATLISIIFATIWEMEGQDDFVLTMLLAAEGALFYFAGKNVNEIIFRIFGRIALLCAFRFSFDIDDFGTASIAMGAIIAALLYSVGKPKKTSGQIWALLSIILSSIHILYWSFEQLPDFVWHDKEFLSFILPVAWAIGMAYSIIKTKHSASPIAGLIFIGILSFVGWEEMSGGNEVVNFVILGLLLVGIFSILSSFFIDEEELATSASEKLIATIATLGLSTISVLVYGAQNLDEPHRSIFWVIWGGILFSVGISKQWPRFRYFGIGMFLFLIGKLYLIDVWEWDSMVRFLAFFCLAIALLGISFTYIRNNKD